MSLKLYCALPVTLNSARVFLAASKCLKTTARPVKQINFCAVIQQSRWLSTERNSRKPPEKQKNPIKRIYYGPLTAHVRAVKIFSISSSFMGLTVQPLLYKEIVATANIPIIMATYTFVGFFTVVTPLLLHLITRKYVTELFYNEETDTYIAKTLNLFCRTKEIEFKTEDVFVPDIPGMFCTFHIKGKPIFVDSRNFDCPEHYGKLMGFDKPLDFKLFKPEETSTSSK